MKNKKIIYRITGFICIAVLSLVSCGGGSGDDETKDPLPSLSISDVIVDEAANIAVLTVVLSAANNQSISVDYGTVDDSAAGSADYVASNGTLSFAAGETSASISVVIADDDVPEPDESFYVKLNNATGATLRVAQAMVIINDNDPLLKLSVNNVVVNESLGVANVMVELNSASTEEVKVNYATLPDTALAPQDFIEKNGTLVFAIGETRKVIDFTISDNVVVADDKTFYINLSDPVGATLTNEQASVTIQNDDPPAPPVAIPQSGDGQITLRWNKVPGAMSYNVYYAEETGVNADNYESLAGVAIKDATSGVKINDLNSDAQYYFTVTSVAGAAESSSSAERSASPYLGLPESTGDNFQESSADGSFSAPPMVVIPAGSFEMGDETANNGESLGFSDEKPVHTVTFAYKFALSQTEVTFDDYDKYLKARALNPVDDPNEITFEKEAHDRDWGRGARPVIYVSWQDIQAYINWLNEQLGLTGQENAYRLPTEAEWEYAARAGNQEFAYGIGEGDCPIDHNGNNLANFSGNDSNLTYDKKNGQTVECVTSGQVLEKSTFVGSYAPNAWGLYDMHGNVWELTQDCYVSHYNDAPDDGSARVASTNVLNPDNCNRTVRGGSWLNYMYYIRSAARYFLRIDGRGSDYGFRLAKTL